MDETKDMTREGSKWYHKPWMIIFAILCFGPLGLIPLWTKPKTSIHVKIWVSVAVTAFTIWMTISAVDTFQKMVQYYQQLAEVLK